MKTKAFAIGLMALCLSACASLPSAGDSRATDLEVMRLGVKALAQPREPQGAVRNPDEAESTEQAWNLLLELDDIKFHSNGDKHRNYEYGDEAVKTIAKSRQRACRFYQLKCKRTNKENEL